MNLPEIVLGLGFLLSFLMAVALGGNDAASPTANVVGAKVLTIRKAVVLFAVFSILGALTQGYMNMRTIGIGLVSSIDLLSAILIVASAFIWIMFCNILIRDIRDPHDYRQRYGLWHRGLRHGSD
jgi:phosphate/sulfate permease